MKSKRIIGLTGSIATGKSTVSEILKENNYKVIDADKIAHQLMEIGNINYNAIVKEFGEEILNPDKTINRSALGKIVFNDKRKLKLLNKLTHKNIFNKIEDDIRKSNENIIFVDVPLLVELLVQDVNPKYYIYDEVWLVYTSRDNQIKRLIDRNELSRDDAMKRINSQMSIEDKKQYADIIIDNNGDLEQLRKKVNEKLRLL